MNAEYEAKRKAAIVACMRKAAEEMFEPDKVDQILELLTRAKDKFVVLGPHEADKEFIQIWHDINAIELKILQLARKYKL